MGKIQWKGCCWACARQGPPGHQGCHDCLCGHGPATLTFPVEQDCPSFGWVGPDTVVWVPPSETALHQCPYILCAAQDPSVPLSLPAVHSLSPAGCAMQPPLPPPPGVMGSSRRRRRKGEPCCRTKIFPTVQSDINWVFIYCLNVFCLKRFLLSVTSSSCFHC